MTDKSVHNIDRNACTGCMMCGDICAKHAISFSKNKGFWYPEVDSEICTNCGLCSIRCPAMHEAPSTPEHPVACYGAKTKDEGIREESTSGGFFSELAFAWLKEGGVIAGAIYGKDQEIIHVIEKDANGVARLRQSKYAQSNTEGIYKKTKQYLTQGTPVLFCGTPCQVEALKAYLNKSYDNLLTMDFICLGICSPLVYRKYLDMLEKKYASKVKYVWFKNKRTGWRSVGTAISFENGKEYFRPGPWDLFMRSFIIDSLSMRPNCEHCRFRKIPHNSDFTLGDFWGLEKVNPQVDDNKGMSAVFVNTEKAVKWFSKIQHRLDTFETTDQKIIEGNFSAIRSKAPHANSAAFMDYIVDHTMDDAMTKYSAYKGLYKWKMEYTLIKYNIKQILKKYGKS